MQESNEALIERMFFVSKSSQRVLNFVLIKKHQTFIIIIKASTAFRSSQKPARKQLFFLQTHHTPNSFMIVNSSSRTYEIVGKQSEIMRENQL